MNFIAEIIEIKQRKTVDNEHEYTIKLRTSDTMIMSLSAIPADTIVVVEIKDS